MSDPERVLTSLGEVFTTKAARDAGLSRHRLRSRDLERPFHGVRAVITPEEHDDATAVDALERATRRRALQYRAVMTGNQFFSHVTAAVVWGLPLPRAALDADRIDVAVRSPKRNPESSRVRGHEVHPRLVSTLKHPEHGVRIASVASTWAMLGAVLRHPYDLVAVADAAVKVPLHRDDAPAMSTRAMLRGAMDAGRRRGVGALREALPRVRERVSSRGETWARLRVVDAGLPEPETNVDVYDAGEWIARVDLAYLKWKIAVEFEGLQHLTDPDQWVKDIARYDRLVEAGWRVIRITRKDAFSDPAEFIARVRRAIARADS